MAALTLDQMISSRRKPRSPEAEAQRAHDVKVVEKMKRKLHKQHAPYRKALKAAQKRPPTPPFDLVSRCASEGEKIQTRSGGGQIHTYESAGHKCPDLW